MSVFFKNIILIGSEVLTEKVSEDSGSSKCQFNCGDYSGSNCRQFFNFAL